MEMFSCHILMEMEQEGKKEGGKQEGKKVGR
jgi:hypothetical protein